MYRGTELPFFDFSGGMASNKPSTLIGQNQAQLLYNVVITSGNGIKGRNGNTAFNSSAMTGNGAVTGLQYFKLSTGTDFLVAISGTKIYKSDSLDGTMDDITGAVTITSSQDNIWTSSVTNDLAIFVGGAPNAPIKYSGSGNAAVLAGSPPNGNFGFTANNRFFIGNTSANPSRLAWSVLSNPEDWTGTGSGTTDVQANDGDVLVGAAVLSNDVVLLFKQNSIHKMFISSAPFPVFKAFNGIGAVGKNAIVVVDGLAYFITPSGKMMATDGNQIVSFSDDIDDIWTGLKVSRLPYIQGIRYVGQGLDHIMWFCSTGSATTNDLCIIWDLTNKCWLQHTTGHTGNTVTLTQSGVLYMGAYDGKIYKMDVASTYTDASVSTSTIPILWRSGWGTQGSLQTAIHPFRINVAMKARSVGNLRIAYGFDFASDISYEDVSMVFSNQLWDTAVWDTAIWGDRTDIVRSILVMGRGDAFQVTFSNSVSGQTFEIEGFTVSGKKSGQKLFQVA